MRERDPKIGQTPTVKICGLTDEATVHAVLRLAVDQVGFVFAKSKRRVTPEQAGSFIRLVKMEGGLQRTKVVGVFVEPSREELTAVMAEAPLDVIQLHSQESAEFCHWIKEHFNVEVYRVISLTEHAAFSKDACGDSMGQHPSSLTVEAITALLTPYKGAIDAILLDTYDPMYGGGSGKTFPWEAIPLYRDVAHQLGIRLIAAGGLTPENVRTLVQDYQPDGVDVSSGVETDNKKDIDKIIAFIERVKSDDSST